MKLPKILLFTCFSLYCFSGIAQEKSSDYIEFNDRKNTVHGVYLGISAHYGEMNDENAYLASLKVAYVANQEFEVGFAGTVFYSEQDIKIPNSYTDLFGAYGGLHLEPIFFSKSKVNLSFPVMIGAGAASFIDDWDDNFDNRYNNDEWDAFFIAETGANLLYNLSRYVQIEAGVRYRVSSKIDLVPNSIKNINGFSGGIGIKIGVFNMGRNRYKKNITNGN